jgi:hypothetical protein
VETTAPIDSKVSESFGDRQNSPRLRKQSAPRRALQVAMMGSSAGFYRDTPLAAWPRRRNVLGYEPCPQILNEPKSLYQSPFGTSGFDSIQRRSSLRSAMLIARSRIRSIKCWRMPSGRLPQFSILGISRQRPFGPIHRQAASLPLGRRRCGNALQV